MPFSSDEIATKRFVVALRGYDRAEVDAYLRALANDQARLLQRIQELERDGASGSDTEYGGEPGALLDDVLRRLHSLRRQLRTGSAD